MKPSIQEVEDFIEFLKTHVPTDDFKCMNVRLLTNYIENPFEILDGLRELEVIEKDLTKDEGYWIKSNKDFQLITAKNVMNYVFEKRPIEKGIDKDYPVIEPKKTPQSLFPTDTKHNNNSSYCVFFEDLSGVEYFDDKNKALDFLATTSKSAFLANLLKKATIKLVIEDV